MNFGNIKDVYAKFLVESYVDKTKNSKEKKYYKNFIKSLVESPILKTQFIVYKNIENGYFESEVSAVEYLKENISLFDKFPKKNIIKENEKLIINMPSDYIFEQNYVGYETKKEIYESLHNLIILEKNADTINKIHNSFEVLKKWLTTPKQVSEGIKKPKVDANKFLNVAVEKFNEKYFPSLNEEEKRVVKVIMSNNNSEKESLLKDMIKESITLINSALKEYGDTIDVKAKLLEAKDIVYNMEYNEKTFKEDITKVYDLKKSLTN